jgi:hypothetical protein
MSLELALGIVGSLAIVISMITLALEIFQKPIKEKEMEVKKLIDIKLNEKVDKSKEIIKDRGLENFVNELIALNSFKKNIDHAIEKSAGNLFWLGLTLIGFSTLAGLLNSFSTYISTIFFILDIEIFIFMCNEFRYLQDINEKVNSYLKGKSITEITRGKIIRWKLK